MGGPGGPHHGLMDPAAVTAVADALHAVPGRSAVVLAVSGGPDSTAMAHLVTAARPDLTACVIHICHGLRDDREDEAAARAHAQSLGLAFRSLRVSVRPAGTGPEDAARRARMAALATAAREHHASFVCTGHTADDQAETVLLNLARGAGLSGLAGIPAVRALDNGVWLVRPLLGLRRSVARAVADATGLPVAVDPSNDDPGPRRNRARHDVLVRLASLTGGGTDPVDALARAAAHARRDAAALDSIAEAAAAQTVVRWGPVRAVPTPALDGLPAAIAGRVVQRLLSDGGAAPAQSAVEAVLGMRDGHAATLAGGTDASRGGGWLAVMARDAPALPPRELAGDRARVPELGIVVTRDDGGDAGVLPPWAPERSTDRVRVAAGARLIVRRRCTGDRVTTAGGTRSLADAMADAGVPRVARGHVPVVADDDGILWVPGVAVRAGAEGSTAVVLRPDVGQ